MEQEKPSLGLSPITFGLVSLYIPMTIPLVFFALPGPFFHNT